MKSPSVASLLNKNGSNVAILGIGQGTDRSTWKTRKKMENKTFTFGIYVIKIILIILF
jgi:hypothetical protein